MKKRIWELDAFRGLCILGVICVHFVYDLTELFALVTLDMPDWFLFIKQWGGILFILLSGICATLGHRSVRRGVIVFVCGLIISLVTFGMYKLDFADKSIIIYFGVLHCLGTCMILWPIFRKLPWWVLAPLGIALTALGMYLGGLSSETPWLLPFGLLPRGLGTSDYFPLFPHLGYFLVGAALGKTLYRGKTTLLPKVHSQNILLRFLQFCGRHSLEIYLLHQPILAGICFLMMA